MAERVIVTAKGPVPRNLRAWLPGEQGPNGGGSTPKRQRSVAKAIREMLSYDPGRLIQLLLEIAEDRTARDGDRIRAVQELLDRGYGKPKEVGPLMDDGDPLEHGQLEQAIHAILTKRIEDATIEADSPAELPAAS
jgi:hypothetical protein